MLFKKIKERREEKQREKDEIMARQRLKSNLLGVLQAELNNVVNSERALSLEKPTKGQAKTLQALAEERKQLLFLYKYVAKNNNYYSLLEMEKAYFQPSFNLRKFYYAVHR